MLGITALLAAVVVVILACGEGATTTTSGGSSSAGSSNTYQTSQFSQKAAKVGDTITISGVATTLVSVKQLQSSQYDPTPAAGQGYYVLHVKQVNTGPSPADYNEFDFKVLTGAGSTVNQTFISAEPTDKMLQSGQIAPNGSVEGDLVYELGTSDQGAKLVWQPNFDNSLDHVWNLGL